MPLNQGEYNMSDNISNKPSFYKYIIKIIITECICLLTILAVVLVTKYFFKPEYKKLKNFYKNSICSETDVREVIEKNYEL